MSYLKEPVEPFADVASPPYEPDALQYAQVIPEEAQQAALRGALGAYVIWKMFCREVVGSSDLEAFKSTQTKLWKNLMLKFFRKEYKTLRRSFNGRVVLMPKDVPTQYWPGYTRALFLRDDLDWYLVRYYVRFFALWEVAKLYRPAMTEYRFKIWYRHWGLRAPQGLDESRAFFVFRRSDVLEAACPHRIEASKIKAVVVPKQNRWVYYMEPEEVEPFLRNNAFTLESEGFSL